MENINSKQALILLLQGEIIYSDYLHYRLNNETNKIEWKNDMHGIWVESNIKFNELMTREWAIIK